MTGTTGTPQVRADTEQSRTRLPDIDWAPTEQARATARLTDFARAASARIGRELPDYRAIHEWSVADPGEFWSTVATYFDVLGAGLQGTALAAADMPGARWFPDATVNYAENLLRHAEDPGSAGRAAVVTVGETATVTVLTWRELRDRVAGLATALRELGVRPGDRVAAVLPNTPEAIIGLLAAAAVGAIWTVNSPELAVRATVARLSQLAPTVLIGCGAYRFNGKTIECTDRLTTLADALPSVRHLIIDAADRPPRLTRDVTVHDFGELSGRTATPVYETTAFDHPLWVLFSSGTTGAPKGIVHGHGGMLLESLKSFALQYDCGSDDICYVAANTSWMVWNAMVNALSTGAAVVTYSGSPTYDGPDRHLRNMALTGATLFGTGAAYLQLNERAATDISGLDLTALRFIFSTGSPLPDSTWRWVRETFGPAVHLGSDSGGTDICSCFVGSNPLEPARIGVSQGPMLGVDVQAWNDRGERVADEVGEMVITAPMPSMPLRFWNDDNDEKYRAAYFDRYPGVWWHGDWITETEDGAFVVHGRSDATLNRQGVRLGSADVYAALGAVPDIADSMVIGVERPGGGYYMPLFVVLEPGVEATDELRERIVATIRARAGARYVPDEIVVAPAIPTTHTGKKIEVPIKKLYLGQPVERAVNLDALSDPDSVAFYRDHAARILAEAGDAR
ncbi:putative acetoacetate-CoA ligase [Nocardia nova SH22a]|uniref:Putative acetoacetate-CoA ligase n=1 Tax=Nocardia nova SH22a TaxID=1415166 RepID=W5THC6_9NOCA|nr:acetoacetate--CoA ligase [Nocardia nova]AHH18564.1 putative acetoacetate-CoA ligase [Nocardia nova SH22a]